MKSILVTCIFLLQLKKLHQKQLLHIIFEQNFDQTEIYCNKKILYRQNILTRSLTIVVGDREVNDVLAMNYLSTGQDGFDICYADVVMCISEQLRLFYSLKRLLLRETPRILVSKQIREKYLERSNLKTYISNILLYYVLIKTFNFKKNRNNWHE